MLSLNTDDPDLPSDDPDLPSSPDLSSSPDTLSSTKHDSERVENLQPQQLSADNSDSEDTDIHQLSISDILKSPKMKGKKTNRKKALNYRAVRLVKSLFPEKKVPKHKAAGKSKRAAKPKPAPKPKPKTNVISTVAVQPSCSGVSSSKESWYCVLCRQEKQLDMIQCNTCRVWVHEECCGLTSKEEFYIFVCPSCADSD